MHRLCIVSPGIWGCFIMKLDDMELEERVKYMRKRKWHG